MPWSSDMSGWQTRPGGAEPFAAFATEALSFLNHSSDLWLAGLADAAAITARAAHRLQTLVAHARRHSPFYADLYRGLPAGRVCLEDLPVVNKARLMSSFDEWVTRRDLKLDALRHFSLDPARIGRPYLGQYAVWTSSGTTGTPGMFVQDPQALAVYEALFAVRNGRDARRMLHALAAGARFAYAAATDGHFSGITMWRRMMLLNPWMATQSRAISILQPAQKICDDLSDFKPEILTSYASQLTVLAEQQQQGRLDLRLQGIWSGGERLSPRDRAQIAGAFGCPVIDDYGASEFLNIASSCECGTLHANSDWVILEPVDRDGRPVPPGVASSSVLLTNLANFVQPIIRYELGDSITVLPQGCPCGSSLPALRVEGRCDDTLRLEREDGGIERVAPLALCTVIEERAGVYHFQIVQEGGRRLVLHVDGHGPQAAHHAERCLNEYLAELGAGDVSVRVDPSPPLPEARSGKLRRVCVRLSDGAAAAAAR